METAVLAILNLGLFLVAGVFFNLWQKTERARQNYLVTIDRQNELIQTLSSERDELLRQKFPPTLRPINPSDSPFDQNAKMPDRSARRPAYVSVAQRRAQAEAASLGPQTHTEQVRENNAKAMESA